MNIIDKIVNVFNPESGLKREQARIRTDFLQSRKFDAVSDSRRNSGWFRPSTTASGEVSAASTKLAATAQELCRNNPLAKRIQMVWADNAIAAGVKLSISSNNKRFKERYTNEFESWASSTAVDYEGHNNLYGLQHLWMMTIVESGGVFVRRHWNTAKKFPLQLQTIEQGYLDKSKSGDLQNGGKMMDGIEYDANGQVVAYWLLEKLDSMPSLARTKLSKRHPVKDIHHLFRKDRAGQHLGIPWLTQIATTLHKFDTLIDAKMMQQQIAACFGAIVTEADTAMGTQDADMPLVDSIEPAMIEYVKAGTEITQLTPPKADNSHEFETKILRMLAVGGGITYGQLIQDYSKDSFSSGRLSLNDFNTSLDRVQQNMIEPCLNKVLTWFDDAFVMKGGSMSKVDLDWVFPPRAMMNPKEDIDVIKDKVRAGFMTPRKAVKLFGEDIEKLVVNWSEDKKLFDKYKLPFDIDPSIFASTGNQLDDNDAASANKESEKPKVKAEKNDSSKPS